MLSHNSLSALANQPSFSKKNGRGVAQPLCFVVLIKPFFRNNFLFNKAQWLHRSRLVFLVELSASASNDMDVDAK
ncbi:hypothetical protein CXF74_06755 [Psychromonas sp. Urea-02u-13]|nr:hypothetical protein CXF74_06755 [Psychromonas sp. Urea-02u-13]